MKVLYRLIILLVMGWIGCVSCVPDVLSPSPDTVVDRQYTEIAYLSNRTGLMEIWLHNLNTGLEMRLTQTDCGLHAGGYIPKGFIAGVQRFRWSPDGQRIAYLTMCSPIDPGRLHIYELRNGHQSLVAGDVDATGDFSWAPSGKHLVFSAITQGTVFYVEIGEAEEWRLESVTRTLAAFPTWSPNGRYIAYRGPEVGLPGTGSRTYLSIVDIGWHHVEYDPPPQPTGGGFPDARSEWIVAPVSNGLAWSHDSRYLAIANVREYVPGSLVLVEVTEQTAHKRSGISQHSLDLFGPDFYTPIFSPDDETLYFVSVPSNAEYGSPFGSIYSIPVQDLLNDFPPSVRVVSPDGILVGFPSLSPDGRWFLYAVKMDDEVSEIWLQTVENTHRQRLIGDDFVNIQPAWRPRP